MAAKTKSFLILPFCCLFRKTWRAFRLHLCEVMWEHSFWKLFGGWGNLWVTQTCVSFPNLISAIRVSFSEHSGLQDRNSASHIASPPCSSTCVPISASLGRSGSFWGGSWINHFTLPPRPCPEESQPSRPACVSFWCTCPFFTWSSLSAGCWRRTSAAASSHEAKRYWLALPSPSFMSLPFSLHLCYPPCAPPAGFSDL